MKFVNRIKQTLRKKSTTAKAMIIGVTVGIFASTTMVFAGWSPNRPTFDWNNPAQRKGSENGPVLNSFVNTPFYGDERAFFDAARTDNSSQFRDVLPEVAGGSKEVILRTYIHNNANQDTNDTVGVAKDAKVRIDLPTGTEKALRARSYISISNPANGFPAEVTDTTELVDSQAFSLDYVEGSAKLYNAANEGGFTLSDQIVGSGAPIGYEQMNGNLPGCFEFQAFVEIRVKILTPQISLEKSVKKAGTENWQEQAVVKPGDKVQWMLAVQNKGSVDLTNVQVSDQLPPHVALVPGSVRYIDAAQDVVQNDGPLFTTGGIDTGTWKPNGGFYIRFDTTAKDDFEGCEVSVRNIGYVKSTQSPEISDPADVKIVKENCAPVQPVVSCDALSSVALGERRFRYTVAYTAENATLKTISYDFGDDSDNLVTDKTTVEHTYDADGTYVTRATLTFEVDGQDQVVSGNNCVTTVSATTPKDNCPIPGKENLPKDSPECKETPDVPPTTTPVTPVPTMLPDTGAGNLAVIFLAVSAGATAAYNVVLRRSNG